MNTSAVLLVPLLISYKNLLEFWGLEVEVLALMSCFEVLFWNCGLVTNSCLTPETSWTVACQAPLSMGFPRQEHWSGLIFPSPGDPTDPASAALQVDPLVPEPSGEPLSWNQFIPLVQRVWLLATPCTASLQASLSITNSWCVLKFMAIELVMSFNRLILCCPLLLLPSIFPSIRVLSNESVLHIGWPKCWSFSFSISPSKEYSGLISSRMDWLDLLAVQGTLKSSPIPHFKSINSLVLSFLYSPTLIPMHDHWKNHSFEDGPLLAK